MAGVRQERVARRIFLVQAGLSGPREERYLRLVQQHFGRGEEAVRCGRVLPGGRGTGIRRVEGRFARPVMAWLDLAWLGSAWLGSARVGLARPVSFLSCCVLYVLVPSCLT